MTLVACNTQSFTRSLAHVDERTLTILTLNKIADTEIQIINFSRDDKLSDSGARAHDGHWSAERTRSKTDVRPEDHHETIERFSITTYELRSIQAASRLNGV